MRPVWHGYGNVRRYAAAYELRPVKQRIAHGAHILAMPPMLSLSSSGVPVVPQVGSPISTARLLLLNMATMSSAADIVRREVNTAKGP